jgi:L-lysine exporter family protein LysE/ArgO
MFAATVQGLLLGGSMIIPIGAQNSHILNQGLKRNHHIMTATICILCDVVLIGAGVFGGGKLLGSNQTILMTITLTGVAFLLVYGAMAFKNAWQYKYKQALEGGAVKSRKMVILATLAVTLLNPHVYLDTVVVLGSIGGKFSEQNRIAFAAGTMLASVLWFYGLALGAASFSQWLCQPKVQRCIDITVGCIMWILAYSLATSIVHVI